MTVEALLPVIAQQQDDEVLNLADEEVFDFLGDMGFQSVVENNNANVAAPVLALDTPAFPFPSSIYHPTTTSAVSRASIVSTASSSSSSGQAVSPAASVSGPESGDDESSFSYSSHVKKQKAATTKPSSKTNKSPEDAALLKKNRRRERNREHAKRCRSRKKDYLKSLEASVVELKQENEKLHRIMMMKFSPEEVASLMNANAASPAATTANAMMVSPSPQPDVAPSTSAAANDYLQALRDACDGVAL